MRKNTGRHKAAAKARKPSRSGLKSLALLSKGPRIAAVTAACGVALSLGVASQGSSVEISGAAADAATAVKPVTAATDAAVPFTRPGVTSNPAPAKTDPAADPSVKTLSESAVPVDDPAGAQKYAAGILGNYGWSSDQMSCLVDLWNKESDWRTSATNPSSLAYGIAQSLPAEKMDSTGSDWKTNYQTQIKWGLEYIKGRYGSPCGAWQHEVGFNWY